MIRVLVCGFASVSTLAAEADVLSQQPSEIVKELGGNVDFSVATADDDDLGEEEMELLQSDDSVSNEGSRQAWWSRRRRRRRAATKKATPAPTKKAAPAPTKKYTILGSGKCLSAAGKDPKYSYHGGKGTSCEALCNAKATCHGYSKSSYNNCILWNEAGLKKGGAAWGGASCHVKAGSAVTVVPKPASTTTSSYQNLGSGKCLRNGKDPQYNYHHGIGSSSCKSKCDALTICHGYSVSSFGNCLLWKQSGLSKGGAAWGGASCLVKAGSAASAAKPATKPAAKPTAKPTTKPSSGWSWGARRRATKTTTSGSTAKPTTSGWSWGARRRATKTTTAPRPIPAATPKPTPKPTPRPTPKPTTKKTTKGKGKGGKGKGR